MSSTRVQGNVVSVIARPTTHTIDRMWRDHHYEVYRLVHKMVDDRIVAEDITSEVFIRALRGYDQLAPNPNIGGWLTRIAQNLVRDRFRSSVFRKETVFGDISLGVDDSPYLVDVDEIVRDRSDRDVADLVRCAVEGLRPRWREVIELRFYLGLSVEATAERLGVHRDAAKALQWRAVNHLRHMFNNSEERTRRGQE